MACDQHGYLVDVWGCQLRAVRIDPERQPRLQPQAAENRSPPVPGSQWRAPPHGATRPHGPQNRVHPPWNIIDTRAPSGAASSSHSQRSHCQLAQRRPARWPDRKDTQRAPATRNRTADRPPLTTRPRARAARLAPRLNRSPRRAPTDIPVAPTGSVQGLGTAPHVTEARPITAMAAAKRPASRARAAWGKPTTRTRLARRPMGPTPTRATSATETTASAAPIPHTPAAPRLQARQRTARLRRRHQAASAAAATAMRRRPHRVVSPQAAKLAQPRRRHLAASILARRTAPLCRISRSA